MKRTCGAWGALWLACMLFAACGDDAIGDRGPTDAGGDAAPGDGPKCSIDADCDDGVYCNGVERCAVGRCADGRPVACDDGIACTVDSCSHTTNSCRFLAPDEDGDGHTDAKCLGPDEESLGEDCDDTDADTFPGNAERCDLTDPTHDEDCVDTSFGTLDDDADGYVDARCCAVAAGGTTCGTDCDDASASRYPEHPEICDGIDNDCDDAIDVGTEEVPWYVDADGDGYGNPDDEAVQSCAPLMGRSLRTTDCDEARASIHPAAREVCDGVDNDCDGKADGDGVCDCAPGGSKQACACDDTSTGSQLCVDGAWSQCDCSECVTGVRDCLGDLIPRECLAGRWTVHAACSGARPICLAGQCVCADGTVSCDEVADVVAPFVFGTSPVDDANTVPQAGTVVSAVFSEAIKPSTLTPLSFYLRDAYGRDVATTLAIGGNAATLVPAAPLLPGMGYTAVVTTAVTDLAGNPMLSSQVWQFVTETGLITTEVTAPGGVTYTDLSLSVNAGGNALLLIGELLGGGGGPVAVQVAATARIGGTWLANTGLTGAAAVHASSVAMDDANTGFALIASSAPASIYVFNGTNWVAAAANTANMDSLVDPPVAVDGMGYGMVPVKNTSELGHRARAPAGTFSVASYATSSGAPTGVRVDVGPGGYGVIGWIKDDSTAQLRHSQAGLVTWAQTAAPAPVQVGILGQDVAASATGQVMQVWSEDRPSITYVQKYVLAQLVSANNQPVGNAVELSPGTSSVPMTQVDPRVDFDATGNAIALFRDDAGVYASRYVAATGWGSAVTLSVIGLIQFSELQLAVAANGKAVAAWLQTDLLAPGGAKELWTARFAPATGWASARRISASGIAVPSFDVGIDATGGSLAVWDQANHSGYFLASP